MTTKVRVTADASGNVIVRSNKNAEFGHIRVEQTRMVFDDNGFARKKVVSALIPGRVEDLSFFGWVANQEVEGKIIIRESLEPFNKKDPKRDYKIAGDSGIVCTHDDYPIYRRHFYVTNESAQDETISHTNAEEIQAAYKEAKENEIVQSDEFNELD